MGEGHEPMLTMIRALTGIADPAKGQIMNTILDERRVDGCGARHGALQEAPGCLRGF